MKVLTTYLLVLILVLLVVVLRILVGQDSTMNSIERRITDQGNKISILYDFMDAECDLDACGQGRQKGGVVSLIKLWLEFPIDVTTCQEELAPQQLDSVSNDFGALSMACGHKPLLMNTWVSAERQASGHNLSCVLAGSVQYQKSLPEDTDP